MFMPAIVTLSPLTKTGVPCGKVDIIVQNISFVAPRYVPGKVKMMSGSNTVESGAFVQMGPSQVGVAESREKVREMIAQAILNALVAEKEICGGLVRNIVDTDRGEA